MDKKTIRKRKRGFISFLLSLVLAVQCFAVSASAKQYTITVTGSYDNWNYSGINVGSVLKNGDTLTRAAGQSVDSSQFWDEQFSITYNNTAGTQLGDESVSSTINNSNYKHWKVTYISTNSGAQFIITLKGMLTVTFDSQGGTQVADIPTDPNQTVAKPTAPTKSYYTFGGWYKEAACINAWNFSSDKVTEDITLYAKWTQDNYTVTLNTNGGTINSGNVTSYTYGTGATLPTDVTKAGHTFGGWYDNAALTGTAVTSISASATGNKTYWAKWTATVYAITWKNYDDTTLKTDTVPYGDTPSYGSSAPTRPATAEYTYTFSGWSPPIAAVTGDAVYTAQFTADGNIYRVTFDSNGGNIVTPTGKDVKYGETYGELPVPTRNGYDFLFWSTETEGGTQITEASNVTAASDHTLYAQWKPKSGVPYKVLHYKQEISGSGYYLADTDELTGTAFSTVTPAVKQYTGFESPEAVPVTISYDGSTEAAYYYTRKLYTVTFDSVGGSHVPEQRVRYEANAEKPSDPVRKGYTFGGWYNGGAAFDFGSQITEDTTLTAKWNTRKYTITFVNYDGTVLQRSAFDYGAVPVYTGPVPTKAADAEYTYTFNGWDKEIVPVTGDAEYTAVFSKNGHYPPSVPVFPSVSKYTVTWKNYDGTVLERDTGVPYGSYPSYDGATPTKEADGDYTYNFTGWTPDITYVTGDVTYTAKFSETALPVSPEEGVPEEDVSDAADDTDSIVTDDDNDEPEDIIEDVQEDVIGYYVEVTPTVLSDSVFRLVMKEAGKNGKNAERDLCWDIRLFRTVNGETEKQTYESEEPIKVEVSLTPEQIQLINKYDSFNIVRVHNGNLELLECVYDKQKGAMIFESDRFSDYALIHEPKHIEQEVTESDDNPGTGTADSTLCFAVLISAAVLILSRKRRA